MVYDPQRDRRRPRPSGDEPAPIEAILDVEPPPLAAPPGGEAPVTQSGAHDDDRDRTSSGPVVDDPPPDPSVTPQPADPWSDQLLFGASVSTIVGVIVALLVFRWLWVRSRRSSSAGQRD